MTRTRQVLLIVLCTIMLLLIATLAVSCESKAASAPTKTNLTVIDQTTVGQGKGTLYKVYDVQNSRTIYIYQCESYGGYNASVTAID